MIIDRRDEANNRSELTIRADRRERVLLAYALLEASLEPALHAASVLVEGTAYGNAFGQVTVIPTEPSHLPPPPPIPEPQ